MIGWTAAGELKIKLTSPPVDNAANEGLVRLLADVLGVKKREVSIVSGHSSRKKKIEVPESCKNRLSSFNDI